jgi:hypothetical protein
MAAYGSVHINPRTKNINNSLTETYNGIHMNIEAKDVIAAVTIVALAILLAFDKIDAKTFSAILGIILGFYFGMKSGIEIGKRSK